jgi:integrase
VYTAFEGFMKLIKKNIDKLTLPPKDKPYSKIFHDDTLKGFAIRITSNGIKTFIINKKINNKVFRMNIGRYGEFTVDEARKRASKFLGQLADGIDPSKKKKSPGQVITLQQAYTDYIKTRKSLGSKTKQDYDSLIKNIFPDWKEIPLTSITREMVSKRHAKIGKNHQARANNAFKLLSAIFNFAIYQYSDHDSNEVITDNPALVLTQTRAWFKNKRRTTKISHDQLPAWFEAVKSLRCRTYNSIEISVKYYLTLLLFTGLRKEEAAPLIWHDAATAEELNEKQVSYISLKDKTIFIDKTKNGLEHLLPLSDYLHKLFTEYRQLNKSRFVFPGRGGHSHIKEARKVMNKITEASATKFTLHDLRRTFATMANEIGIPAYTIKRLLNHKTASSDVTAGYIVNDLNYLREPANRIAQYILEIATKQSETVAV